MGDFDLLDDLLGQAQFDFVTSAFGVIMAPDPGRTLLGLVRRLADGGQIAVAGWEPGGVFMVPEAMLELLPERRQMPDPALWTTEVGRLAAGSGCELLSTTAAELPIPFRTVEDAATQLERWAGGWAQVLEALDSAGVGGVARARFVDHLAGFATETASGIALSARYRTSLLALST